MVVVEDVNLTLSTAESFLDVDAVGGCVGEEEEVEDFLVEDVLIGEMLGVREVDDDVAAAAAAAAEEEEAVAGAAAVVAAAGAAAALLFEAAVRLAAMVSTT